MTWRDHTSTKSTITCPLARYSGAWALPTMMEPLALRLCHIHLLILVRPWCIRCLSALCPLTRAPPLYMQGQIGASASRRCVLSLCTLHSGPTPPLA